MKYYVTPDNGTLKGPYSIDEIRERTRAGTFKLDFLLQSEEGKEWISIKALLGEEESKKGSKDEGTDKLIDKCALGIIVAVASAIGLYLLFNNGTHEPTVSIKSTAYPETVPQTESLTKTRGQRRLLTEAELRDLESRGIDSSQYRGKIVTLYSDEEQAAMQRESEEQERRRIATSPPLSSAVIWMPSFMTITNALIKADIISIKPDALSFRFNGNTFNYSGDYTVMLQRPREHKKYFGSAENVDFVVLDNVDNGQPLSLTNATVVEKGSHYIDVVAMEKEWIHSGTYSLLQK